MGYAKVAWVQICRPIDEGGLGIPDIAALNRTLMCRHLCELIIDPSSIWVKWVLQYRLRNKSLWTVNVTIGTWSWRKIGRLRMHLSQLLGYKVGNENTFLLWHDVWLAKGPLLHHFPRGPLFTGLPIDSLLKAVIQSRDWYWLATRRHIAEVLDYSGTLPPLHQGEDKVLWRNTIGKFSMQDTDRIFKPPAPKVASSALLRGKFKTPRCSFILWLSILGRLTTMDKPWMQGTCKECILCEDQQLETHDHLFFSMPIFYSMPAYSKKGG
ncbi:UNVERIFIED_CONTAM: hypothetical protein Slati_2973500 [Sesamum latifolium]|uniref:Reverse transcriptase zinc-binding domain-containing protein n=1 Tax=Sesamum latifolium TaxID=2727402 RepID=A0AAW2VFJ5_9LAMI